MSSGSSGSGSRPARPAAAGKSAPSSKSGASSSSSSGSASIKPRAASATAAAASSSTKATAGLPRPASSRRTSAIGPVSSSSSSTPLSSRSTGTARPSSAASSARGRASTSGHASSGASGDAAADAAPAPIPLHVATDALSRCTTPLLHLVASFLAVAEVHALARANRVMYGATVAADPVWKPRWARAHEAGLGANVQGQAAPAAASSAARGPRGAPAARGRASSASTAPSRTAAASSNGRVIAAPAPAPTAGAVAPKGLSLSAAALAHQQQDLARHSRIPSSLPSSSPYRWALLGALRTDACARFGRWTLGRTRLAQHTLVHKPVAEALGLKVQLRLQLHKRPLLTPLVPLVLFDNSMGCSWRAEAGVPLRDLRGLQVLGHSLRLMQSFPLGGETAAAAASSTTREWVCVRQAQSEQSLSLLEWRVKGTGDARVRPLEPLAAASDSPFEPNAAARARAAASARTAAAAAPRPPRGSMAIPGMEMSVLAGVWGSWGGRGGEELAFLWISLPYPLLLSHLPVPSLPAALAQPRWTPPRDDVDSSLGLHSLRVNVAFRHARRTMWSWFFSQVGATVLRDALPPSGAEGRGAAELRLQSLRELAPKWSQMPSIPWKGQLWSGSFERMCIMDLVVAAEDRVLWVVSQPVSIAPLDPSSSSTGGAAFLSMDEPDVVHYGGEHRSIGVGAVRFELSHSPGVAASADGRRVEGAEGGAGITRLQSLHVALDLRFIDERFGTVYARAGAASLSHALQSRAWAEMDPQTYAQFQHQQMRLRGEPDPQDERPLPALTARRRAEAANAHGAGAGAGAGVGAGGGGAAPAPRFVPNFEVRAAAPGAAGGGAPAGSSSSSSASSSSSSSSGGARRGGRTRGGAAAAARPRPEWQDSVEKDDDDDGGFKF